MNLRKTSLFLLISLAASFASATPTEAQIVDVRTPSEYAAGHVKDAANIDVTSPDFETRIQTLDKKKPVRLYCRSGRRSQIAMDRLKTLGFQVVENIGGLTDAIKTLKAACVGNGGGCPK